MELLIGNKKRAYNKCLMIKNAENECYKTVSIVKERLKKRKNIMWKLKCKEMDIMIGD
jgi:hypothetical protein